MTPTAEHPTGHDTGYDAALALLGAGPLVVLTGAGLSTDSGIPDYRGPGRPPRSPMMFAEFVSGPAARQRYWARSHLGWGRMRHADPNPGHQALAEIDPELLITQNVDGLHERVGQRRLVTLHGRIAEVVCLDCRTVSARADLHDRMTAANPGFAEQHAAVAVNPDGDVELDDPQVVAGFVVPACEECGGVLKPHVVFFGENVPPDRVERCYAAVDDLAATGGTLLVAGSSLTVMSGFRFVRRAAKAGTPLVIVNRGATRGDELATCRLDVGCSELLSELAARRGAAAGRGAPSRR
ncbi:Sir2 family NAD-dependent protein deacetylase [Nocardioides sp. Arc9.136]|uniref:Sir2 family NAD-dependent protein deacetylase n=1 Tax=Nocardioides sp. Arc9.136 TaxID=2996826 RepID=UPI002665080B|nr:Sir2 family NAD-dependent protein deacetylase [Nocardioides sp. Arc9.136]WKN49217.1 NAD-dependent deacetylase [Nocardioides sp. Arc9.136]